MIIGGKIKRVLSLLALLSIFRSGFSDHRPTCPESCSCEIARSRGGSKTSVNELSKLKCGGEEYTKLSIEALQLNAVADHVIQLELSSNGITRLDDSFLMLRKLQKLDLSRNEISEIYVNAFIYLKNLIRLDLSFNKISDLQKEIFKPLQHLEKLKLNNNLLIRFYDGTFSLLPSLKQLDISENPLECDCEVQWLIDWIRNSSVKLSPSPKCVAPPSFSGQLLRKLKLHCHDQSNTLGISTALEIMPMNNQIVFKGDSLNLRCRSLTVGSIGGESRNSKVTWSWKDKDPTSYFDKIKIENRSFDDRGFVESQLIIDHIESEHGGDWHCHLLSEKGNHSSVISVIVISDDTKYCLQTVTKNNKGIYIWPRTVVGFTVDLPCVGEQLNTVGERLDLRASYTCNDTENWEQLNTAPCPYVSETTKILEQFSRANLSIAKSSVLESVKRLRNFTGDGKIFTDVMDVVFIARTIENYLMYVKGEKELGGVLVDIIAAVMQVPQSLLVAAQQEDASCSNMVRSVELIARDTPSLQSHKTNLAVEEFSVTRESFDGITCAWYTNALNEKTSSRFFHCATSNVTALLGTSEKSIEAYIQIPKSLFYQLEMRGKPTQSVRQLIVTMYENNNLFPAIADPEDNLGKDVSSCVVGSNFVGLEVNNLTDPVYIMLRPPALHYPASSPKPVWWDFSLNNGTGAWSPHGCHLSHFVHGLLAFHCDRLGYFGLLQDTSFLGDYSGRYVGAKARLCHPAVYSGAFVLLLCLVVTIVSYVISFSVIQMSRRAKHSILNTWVAIALLCFFFSSGIYQTEDMKVCQGVGLVIHYLSLSALLWMSVTANDMYKRLSKSDTLDNAAEDDLPGMPVPKPILGLYLVGWGIGLIVCGISGAVNLREYAGSRFCFLGPGPALSAIVVPAAMLTLFLLVFYSLTFCAIRNNDMNGQLSEGTQGTENVDLELLEVPVANGCVDRRSVQSMMTADSDEVEDPEHSPLIQLKAHFIVLVLYGCTWVSAALSVTGLLRDFIVYHEDIFSILFCLLAFFLGAFVLYFYCVARSDVRSQWTVFRKLFHGNSSGCCRSRSISDTHVTVPVATSAVIVSNGNHHTVPALSSSSVNSSGLTAKSSHHSNRVKAVKKLNNCDGKEDSVVMVADLTNNVNLVQMHRQMYRSNNSMPTYHEISGPDSAEAFYNPRQSIVARKFFKKQRRNKRNDLGLRRRGDGGGTSDGEVSQARRTWRPSAESAVFLSSDMENASEKVGPTYFAYGSKVNNTNIHVGQSSKHKKCHSPKNPNILSDSDEEPEARSSKLPIDRLVIGAEEEAAVAPPVKTGSSCRSLSRVDEVSVSEEINSTAVNISEASECRQGIEDACRETAKDELTDDDYCGDVTLTTPDYRTVELQCSLGENSYSDLNSEINYCDSTNHDDCCAEPDGECPPDCCSKMPPTNDSDRDEDKTIRGEPECESFNEKIDNLRLHSSQSSATQESPEKTRRAPPQYVTVIDPQYGMVKVTVGEYKEFSHKLSLAPPFEEDETLVDVTDAEKAKKETSV